MTALTGSTELTRFIIRRDRVRIVIWIASIVVLVGLTVAGIKGLFPTQAALDQTAAATQHNAAVIAFNGPAQALNTVGGQVAFQFGAAGLVLVALMSLFMIGRLTRGEEESGRLEMVRSLPVGSHAPTIAASLNVAGMNVIVGLLIAAVLIGLGLPVTGSLVFGVSFILVGFFFAGLAVVVAQITENTRVVYGATGAVVAAAYLLRAIGDIGDGTVSWFSPIGVAQKTRPYAGETWWPFLLLIGATAVLIAAAIFLAGRRDLGGGLVASRPGTPYASRSLGHPLGLAFRLQRGTLIGWGIGVLVGAIAYGWIAPTIDTFVGHNRALADLLAGGRGASLTDSFFAYSFRIVALVGSGFAVQSVLRLRSEETGLRAEPVLATPVSRWTWAASHLTVAFVGSLVLLIIAGLASGLTYGAVGGDMNRASRLLGAALVYAPPMWLIVGLTFALVGLVPRWAVVSWAVFAACLVVGFLGPVLHVPTWLQDVSPFQRMPQLPVAGFTALPLVTVTAIATAFTLVGLGGLRRRDIGRT